MLLIKYKKFNYLLIGQGISIFGDWCASIVLPIVLLKLTNNTYSVAILVLCRFVPGLISSIWIKILNNARIKPLNSMILIDLFRSVIFLGFLFAKHSWQYYVLTFIIYSGSSVFNPFKYAIVKNIVSVKDLPQANSNLAFIDNLFMLIGPIIGGILYSIISISGVVLFNSVTFLISMLFLLGIKKCTKETSRYSYERRQTLVKKALPFIEIKYLFNKNMIILFLILADAVGCFAFGSLNTIFPIMIYKFYNNSAIFYGLLMSSLSIGLILGNLLFTQISGKITVKYYYLYVYATVLASVFFALLGLPTYILLSTLFIFMIGLCNSFQDLSITTSIQQIDTTENDIAFYFSFHQACVSFVIIIATLIVPFLITNLGISLSFFALGIIPILVIIPVMINIKRRNI